MIAAQASSCTRDRAAPTRACLILLAEATAGARCRPARHHPAYLHSAPRRTAAQCTNRSDTISVPRRPPASPKHVGDRTLRRQTLINKKSGPNAALCAKGPRPRSQALPRTSSRAERRRRRSMARRTGSHPRDGHPGIATMLCCAAQELNVFFAPQCSSGFSTPRLTVWQPGQPSVIAQSVGPGGGAKNDAEDGCGLAQGQLLRRNKGRERVRCREAMLRLCAACAARFSA